MASASGKGTFHKGDMDLSKKVSLTLPWRRIQSGYVYLRLESSLDGKDLNKQNAGTRNTDRSSGWVFLPRSSLNGSKEIFLEGEIYKRFKKYEGL